MEIGGNASINERTDGDSSANIAGFADHLLTTGVAAFAATRPDLFVGGYFADRTLADDHPGYWPAPISRLPDVAPDASMELVLGFSGE